MTMICFTSRNGFSHFFSSANTGGGGGGGGDQDPSGCSGGSGCTTANENTVLPTTSYELFLTCVLMKTLFCRRCNSSLPHDCHTVPNHHDHG